MSQTRRSFTPEYKREAVRLADDLGNASQAARDLGLAPKLIHPWKRELRDDGRRAFPGNGSPRAEELARLKRELKQAREEATILVYMGRPDLPAVLEPARARPHDPEACGATAA